ncbi:MAG: DNA translocase FtsK 4TM domain-containing protein, partial [Ignavibacteria bacterium]|nr:DNA translocase FtsK 4TM domain-containing protein [Ignavibacteria bacterium]
MLARNRKRNEVSKGGKKGGLPNEKRQIILSILLFAAGLLIFLSLVSYDTADEAGADLSPTELAGIVTGDPDVQARADLSRNWLGLTGALLSTALIKGSIGYAVFALPFMLFGVGWIMFRGRNIADFLNPFMAIATGALLLSFTLGVVRLMADGSPGMEWSGIVGDFTASVLSQLIGLAGAAILVFTAIVIYLVVVTDLDLKAMAERVRTGAGLLTTWIRTKQVERQIAREERARREPEPPPPPPEVSVRRPEQPEDEELPEPAVLMEEAAAVARTEPAVKDQVADPHELRVDIERREIPDEVNLDDERSVQTDVELDYVFPSVELLDSPRAHKADLNESELKTNADLLRATLAEFDVELESVSVTPGPVVTLYELVPAAGVKISRIVSLENDIALKLAAKGIRIMAPIPGRSAVGVEIPNHNRAIVSIRSVINSAAFRDTPANLPLAMGKTISGEIFTDDLSRMPHLLIAGSTGSGKSVGINTILASLLYRMHPSDLKLVIIDPKKIELSQYSVLRHHFLAVSPDIDEEIITNPRNAVLVLKGVEYEMEKRYDRLAAAGVRNIVDYNERLAQGRLKNTDQITHSKIP